MRGIIVRASIVAFIALSVTVLGLCLFAKPPDHYKNLDDLAAQLNSDPTSEHLRDLLNYRADASFYFYKMAIYGASFAKYPDIFREVSKDIRTEEEFDCIKDLASSGSGVFEYHPELKPSDFDRRFQDQKWLKKFQSEAAASTED